MIRSLFFILGLCTTLNLFAGDTLLVNVLSFPKPIQSMANDKFGNIFVSFKDGLYQLVDNEGNLNLIDPDFKGDMIFLDSLVFISGNKDYYSLTKQLTNLRIQNLSWLSLLPVSDHHTVLDIAKDSNDFIYVSTKNRI